MAKKICILSIDGGGIRGILPGTIMVHIENLLQEKTKNKEARLADYFDMISGTSTGGILTCAYLIPDANGRPKLSAQQAVDLYLKKGESIFSLPLKQKLKSLFGIAQEKYSAQNLTNALQNSFENAMLDQLVKPCLITSYNIQSRHGFFMGKQRAQAKPDTHNFPAWHAALATASAPTFFEPALLKDSQGNRYPLVDGGVFANNPAMCAYSEARTMNFDGKMNKPTAKDMFIISLGTGTNEKPYAYGKVKKWGVAQWIRPIVNIMMSGVADTTDYHLKQIFETLGEEHVNEYNRIEPELENAKPDMDEATPENMNNLQAAGNNYVTKNKDQINTIVDKLIAYNS